MRLELRSLTALDSALVLGWRNQPDIRRWMYTDHEIGPEEHAAWLARVLIDPRRLYWIAELDGVPVGLANLVNLTNEDAHWGSYVGEASMRGRGVGAMIEYRVIEHVFGALKLLRLKCEVLSDNERALVLHKRFGFKPEAILKVIKAERAHKAILLGLSTEAWKAHRTPVGAALKRRGLVL